MGDRILSCAFPTACPSGVFSTQLQRRVFAKNDKLCKNMLLYHDDRFESNHRFIAYLKNVSDREIIVSNIEEKSEHLAELKRLLSSKETLDHLEEAINYIKENARRVKALQQEKKEKEMQKKQQHQQQQNDTTSSTTDNNASPWPSNNNNRSFENQTLRNAES